MSTDPAIYSALAPPGSDKQPRAESILEILWRRKQVILVVFLLSVMAAAAAMQFIPKKRTAEARVMLTRTLSGGGEAKGDDTQIFLNTQCEFIRSAAVLSQAMNAPGMDTLSYFEGSDNAIELLKDRLDVRAEPSSTVIAIRVAGSKDDESKAIVNAVAQAYVDQVSDQHRNGALDIFEKMTEERNKCSEERSQAKRYLLGLQAETQSALPGGAAGSAGGPSDNLALQKLKQMADALNDAQLATQKVKGQYEESLKPLGMTLDTVDNDRFVDATAASPQSLPVLASNLTALRQQLIEAKRQFVPTHPAVRSIQAQIKELTLTQAATLKAVYEADIAREREAREQYVTQEQVAHNLDAKATEITMAADKVKEKEHELSELDTKLQQLQLTETIGFDARPLEEASIDPKSAVPNTWRTIGSAAIVGLVLGMMLALAREWVSPSLGGLHHIADQVGVPVLGTLPRVNGRTGRDLARITNDAADSDAAEAFRSIRTSMLFGANDCRTVTITSPAGKDGKTTLATNLAISLAQSGKHVALIDANMRDPFVHTVFDMDNGIGLTSVLDGDDLESSLRRTPIEHLDILTAGPASAEASEKLNSARFSDLCRDLTLRYDHVIFDTPAVAGSNDARVIAAGCDQTILVVRGERSNRFATTTARDALLSVGAQLMGIVMNDWQRVSQAYPPGVDRRDAVKPSNTLARAREGR